MTAEEINALQEKLKPLGMFIVTPEAVAEMKADREIFKQGLMALLDIFGLLTPDKKAIRPTVLAGTENVQDNIVSSITRLIGEHSFIEAKKKSPFAAHRRDAEKKEQELNNKYASIPMAIIVANKYLQLDGNGN